MLKSRYRARWTMLALAILLASPASADWLVTLEGQLVETDGPWTVDGGRLAYVDADGTPRTVALDAIDLEASEEMTAIKSGRDYVPVTRDPEPEPEDSPAAAAGEAPEIVLYQTSWCGYCRKARKLLKELDADFVSKDIERSKEAAREYRKKAGGRRGVPLIAYGDRILRGYGERAIREMVRDQKERSAETSD